MIASLFFLTEVTKSSKELLIVSRSIKLKCADKNVFVRKVVQSGLLEKDDWMNGPCITILRKRSPVVFPRLYHPLFFFLLFAELFIIS